MKSSLRAGIRPRIWAAGMVILASLSVCSRTVMAQRFIFGRADLATGNSPQSVVSADFNGDGVTDLATVNQNDNTVSVFLGRSNGTFAAKVDYSVGLSPRWLVAGDFNRDGKIDLAAVDYTSNTVSILLGNGDGTFQAHVDYPVGGGPTSLVAADFNGDGKLDLAVTNSGANTVSILLGKGDGTFNTHVDYTTGPEPYSIAAADLNGDGKLDLAVANADCPSTPCGPGSVSVLLGNGSGTFQTHVDYNTGFGTLGIAVADLNGDGKRDLAVANSVDGTVSVLLGNGDGTFLPHQDYPAGTGADAVAVNDFNGDGKPDLAVVNANCPFTPCGPGSVSILLGNGNGTFQTHADYDVGTTPRGIVVADFNGDGPLDVAVANPGSNTVSILAGRGDGSFGNILMYVLGDGATMGLTTGNFRRNGITDLAIDNQNCNGTCAPGPVSVMLGNGNGTFATHVDYATGSGPISVVSADVNGDGIPDLLLANFYSNTVSVLLGNGDGTFRPHADYATGSGPIAIAVGDFNGDGKVDLAVTIDAVFPVVDIMLGNGDGSFRAPTAYQIGVLPRSIATGDFNHDGKLDLAIANQNDSTISVLLGNGDGTFRNQVLYPTGNTPYSMIALDLNGDGNLDLVTADRVDNGASVLLGNGDGTFKAPVTYPTGIVALSVTSGDFNGDGKTDLAVANGQARSVSVLPGNGDGTFQPHLDYSAGPLTYPYGITAGDFTGVGGKDLAVATELGVSVILNSPVVWLFPNRLTFGNQSVGTTSASQSFTLSNAGSEPLRISSIVATGDFAATNTCGSTLAIGATCTVTVTFKPTAQGARTGAVVLTDAAASSPQTLGLTGTGVFVGPGVSLSPSSLSFSSQAVGTTSAAQAVTLTNSGNAALNITGISASGDFAQTNNCGSSVAAGANCSISVTFTPTASGLRSGTLSVSDNAPASPQTVSLSGSGNVPIAGVSPSSLTFSSQTVGTTSAAQAVTLSNTGGATLNLSSIATSGDFAQSNNCGSSLTAGAHCAINVTFTPAASGTRSGALSIADNAAGSPQAVGLTGTGVSAAAATLSPSSLNFGNQTVGTTSGAQSITLSNSGGTAFSLTSIAASGDFAQTNNCGSTLSAGASCTINVTFTPAVSGTRSGTLTVTDSAPGSPQTASLTGTGQSPAAASLSPSSLSFGAQAVGTTSAARAMTLSNTGGTAFSLTSIVASGDFAQGNNCGSTLAAGASCTINVTFKPSVSGTRSGTLTVTDNAAGSPQTASLTGTGTMPAASLSPSSLSFGNQPVATTSAALAVTLSNTGSAVLSITSIAASGDFAQSNNCGSAVAAGASCTVNVTFTPTVSGARSGSLTVTDNASGSPQSVSLTGTGTVSAVTLSPSSLSFGNQPLGTMSAPQAVTLTNTGGATLTITSIGATGDFAQSNNCGSTVAAGAICTINVTFTPTAPGARTGTLSVTDNATGSPQSLSLTGTGAVPAASVSPSSLSFGNQTLGITSTAQAVTLSNTGGATLTVSGLAASGDFAQGNNCGSTLAAGASCTINVTFTPTVSGARTGTLTITDNASGSPQTASLNGTGVSVAAVSLSPSSLSFVNQAVGTTSAARAITLSNTGGTAFSLTSIVASGDFAQSNNCGSTVAAGASCTINMTFTPAASGTRSGTLTVTDNAAGSPQTASLSGTGTVPAVSFSPSSLSFGNQSVGTTSGSQSVVLSDNGSAPLNLSSITASGDFAQTNNCGSTVAAGASCTINVTFTPTASGTRSGTLSIADNVAGSPQTVSLTGTGQSAAAASLSPSSLSFGNQSVGTTSAARAITLSNTGGAAFSLTSIVASGDFAQGNNCGSTVAAGASCTINVTFTPTVSGTRNGTLTVTDNAAGSPQTASLAGTGTVPVASVSPSSLSLGSQPLGTTSASQGVTISNTGGAALTLGSITSTGDFGQTNNCGASLAPGGSCAISVTFTPSNTGGRVGTLAITDNAAGSPHSVSLTGSGIALSPAANVSPSSLDFGVQAVGAASNVQTVTLTNGGSGALVITSIGTTTSAFTPVNNCGSQLAAGASCAINITFTPAASGAAGDVLLITDNAGSGLQVVNLTGTGGAPMASLGPTSLAFGIRFFGITGDAQAVTLTNVGNAPLVISGITTSASNFAQENNCGTSLAAGASCIINVTFAFTFDGLNSGTLTVADNTPDSPHSVSLGMAGRSSQLSLSASGLNFGSQAAGSTSSAQSVTLTNSGMTSVSISIITLNSGAFVQTGSCPASLFPGGTCTLSVAFAPTASGSVSGTITVVDSAGDSPQEVSLLGSGSAPSVVLAPSNLSFAATAVGTTSAARIVALANIGQAPLSLTGIGASGDFAQSNNCGSSLAAGTSCLMGVTFAPTTTGTRIGLLSVSDNAAGSAQSVSLSGTGGQGTPAPAVGLSPSGLSFANQLVNTTSSSQAVTLSNTGSAALSIGGIVAIGDFGQTNNCGTSVSAGGSCTINVTFAPSATGARTGTLTITDNAAGSPHAVNLTGTGTAAAISLAPSSLSFTGETVGTSSAAQTVTLTNTGSAPLNVPSITPSGDFSQANNCGTTVAAGGSCTINVTFTPTASGARTGTLAITDNAAGSPQAVALSGSGTPANSSPAAASLQPSSLNFGSVGVGASSGSQSVILTNTGGSPLTVSGIATTDGRFTQLNNCPAQLAAGASCAINVTFTPSFAGTATASLVVTDTAPDSPQSISLAGSTANPSVSLSSTNLYLGFQRLGTTGDPRQVILTNTSAVPATITSITATGDFAQTNNCGNSLAAYSSCTINVTFSPTGYAFRRGTLTVADNATGSPQTVSLSGLGTF